LSIKNGLRTELFHLLSGQQ